MLVSQMDDKRAAIIMVDSNLKHRPYLLPSEKARAYKLRMENLERSADRPAEDCGPLGHNCKSGRSRDRIAAGSNDSARQIQRYLRLNKLHPSLLTLVDNSVRKPREGQKKLPQISMRTGVDLSYLRSEEQSSLVSVMEQYRIKAISMTQAQELRSDSKNHGLSQARILGILRPTKESKPEATVRLPAARISSFFPPNTPPEQMEAQIYEALLVYQKKSGPCIERMQGPSIGS